MPKVQFDFPYPDSIESIHVEYKSRHPKSGWAPGCGHDVKNIKKWDSIDDNEYSKETHQPCVPIQFIWCEGQLHPASDASKIVFTGDSCEQIGAVLYVRDEE